VGALVALALRLPRLRGETQAGAPAVTAAPAPGGHALLETGAR